MLNHGIYTDCAWSVPVTFVDPSNNPVDLSSGEYVAEVYRNGEVAFVFRSTGAAADEGTIDTADAADGILTFETTEDVSAGIAAGLYRLHLKRDSTDDIWTAEATLLVGSPGDRETYLKFDRTTGGSVELPITVVDGIPPDLGGPTGPSGRVFDLGSVT